MCLPICQYNTRSKTISDYQATDGDIVFGCHRIYTGLVFSDALISGSPQRLAGYSINNSPQLFLSYDNATSLLTIDWTLLPVMTPLSLILEYSLDLVYNHTQSDITHQFSNSTTFLLLSNESIYSIYITPHNFTTDDGVITNITACIQLIQQCGVFNEQTICVFFNSENPSIPPTNPSTPINTTVTTTTEEPILLPIIIGVVGAIGGILLILFIVLVFIMLYICCIMKKRNNTTDKQSIHNYEVIDNQMILSSPIHQSSESHYTPMAPLSDNQIPSTYANLK
ncbi:hypothetical protein LOD99_6433 [Oopsacas minuta]|uniref:Uncharacterized protein n=1 Tax=Oopsacas minuta TaxID=111878 RepID=A0AAV7JMF6_9METZ|nr:hypothetical protein LOD99_6433 [Oopsacas minuta]